MAKRISVINFKGGVGKTTLAVHLGCFLSDQADSAKVLLIDVDHQASLSIITMSPESWETSCGEGNTINRIFSSYSTQGAQMPGSEIITRNPFGIHYPNLDIVPSQFELDDTEVDLAGTNIGNPIFSEWRKRTLLSRWIVDSGADENYDFIIFDCPPATKIVSQNAIVASHAYVVPVIPDPVSARGVTHLVNLIANRIDNRLKGYAASMPRSEIPISYVPDTQLAGIVISMAQTHGPSASGYINEHWNQMTALRRQWGNIVLNSIIERATGVPESLGAGWPVFNQTENANVTSRDLPGMFNGVCNELALRLA